MWFPRSAAVLVLATAVALTACSSAQTGRGSSATPAASSSSAAPATSAAASSPAPLSTPTPPSSSASAPATTKPAPTTPKPTPKPATKAAPAATLPLSYSTGDATQLITVVATSTSRTTATVQAWDKSGTTWVKHGPAISGHVGSQGLTTAPSESKSATPIGSFTLTQAFGALNNPGTPLPYFKTTSADWWISQTTGAGASLYNTHQRCSGSCPFTQGSPNEHLMYETPFYNYAVVIDYHAPYVGAGSGFFLHVTDGNPTAGCVSIPQANLVSIMQWLRPANHPRMLIGVG